MKNTFDLATSLTRRPQWCNPPYLTACNDDDDGDDDDDEAKLRGGNVGRRRVKELIETKNAVKQTNANNFIATILRLR